jgi:PAS domain S-box-containing protein
MNDSVLVNFHSHSLFSDGELTPEALAATLAAAGVRYAALTDHDTIEGLPRFQDALKKRGIAFVTGVEMTTQFDGREAHLLAYGFDPDHAALAATLLSLRQARGVEVHSIADSLRKAGTNTAPATGAISVAPNGLLEASEAIGLVHRAGGRVFWAHPLHYESDPAKLDHLIGQLKALGLDGLEAIYAPFSEAEQALLRESAHKHELLVCAGTDLHAFTSASAIEMPRADWIKFREAVFSNPIVAENTPTSATPIKALPPHAHAASRTFHFRPRFFALRILLPTFIVLGLFLAALWGVILPSFEQTLLERKREMIRELTNSAWSILASYHADEQAGLLTREQAQAQAMTRLQNLRYGPEGKDYFWIQDEQPRMIMHPYRADLNGQDLIGFTDPRGVPIFVEFANLVKRSGEGTIDYVWQWNDDPQRLEPKESYVKGFAPWGWIIGTGLYTDDVRQEIARLEQSLINTALVISGAIIALLLFVVQQSYRIEKERQEVVDELRDATERYHTLVEATNEGTLLVLDDRCRYANPTLLNMLGYTARQFEFLELIDLLPREADNLALWERLPNGDPLTPGVTQAGYLKRSDGRLIDCVLTLNPIQLAGQRGFILLAKDVARSAALTIDELTQAAHAAPIGLFRARAARRGVFVDLNPAGRLLLPHIPEGTQPALADLFSDPAEYDHVFQTLLTAGQIDQHILHLESSEATARFIALSARLVRDEQQHPAYFDGLLHDVTAARKQAAGREAEIDRLQSALLFLHEPIARLGREAVICSLETSIAQLAHLMTEREMTAALIASETGAVIGIVTDHDLRARVLAADVDLSAPVRTIMSAPLMKISERALIYEALLRMEEKGVHHLAVEDRDGHIVSVVDSKALIQFQRYGPIVLAREILRAASPDGVVRSRERTAPLVKTLLDSSARPRPVTSMLASICDAATARLIQLAIDDLGPPPAPFAFIAMGSQGRQEQTLLTDQDNGIIFVPPAGASPDRVGDYFLQLGERVCGDLHRAGYTLCRGNVMASNPRWCRALPAWIAGFNEWVQKSEPQEVIDLGIFFDFRTVYGAAELTQELRRHIHAALQDAPAFYHHFAQNALTFKPPFRLPGNIYLGGGATEHAGEINLKDAMMPMVSFARLYALRHQVNQTHTLERIEALAERGVILPASHDEISAAYNFLMQLRLNAQVAALQAGRPLTNIIHPGKLGYIQQELLKQAFAQIAAVQKKISYDFLGGTQ